jgi:hypothetical protein
MVGSLVRAVDEQVLKVGLAIRSSGQGGEARQVLTTVHGGDGDPVATAILEDGKTASDPIYSTRAATAARMPAM